MYILCTYIFEYARTYIRAFLSPHRDEAQEGGGWLVGGKSWSSATLHSRGLGGSRPPRSRTWYENRFIDPVVRGSLPLVPLSLGLFSLAPAIHSS